LRHRGQLSQRLLSLMDEGLAIDGARHLANLAQVELAKKMFESCFDEVDVLITPSVIGEAPLGIDATGDPVFCRYWTLLGLPCIHLPFAFGISGLPVGLQMVGRHGDDRRLLAIAHWIYSQLNGLDPD